MTSSKPALAGSVLLALALCVGAFACGLEPSSESKAKAPAKTTPTEPAAPPGVPVAPVVELAAAPKITAVNLDAFIAKLADEKKSVVILGTPERVEVATTASGKPIEKTTEVAHEIQVKDGAALDQKLVGVLIVADDGTTLEVGAGQLEFTVNADGSISVRYRAIGLTSFVVAATTSETIPLGTLTADLPGISADGKSAAQVSIRVTLGGQPVAGRGVRLRSTRAADDVLLPLSAVTDEQGTATFTVTSALAGVVELTGALEDGGALGSSGLALTFTPSVASMFAPAATRLVDVFAFGDGSLTSYGEGWDKGLQFALAKRYPMYATGWIALNENCQYGWGTGFGFGSYMGSADCAGAPLELTTLFPGLWKSQYAYFPSGTSWPKGAASGFRVFKPEATTPTSHIDLSAAMRFWYLYGTFPDGTGSFQPAIRFGEAPYSPLVSGPIVETATGAYGLELGKLDLPPDPQRTKSVEFRWAVPALIDITGPFFSAWTRMQYAGRQAGWSMSSVTSTGLFAALTDLRSMSREAQRAFLFEARRLQVEGGQSPSVVFVLAFGAAELVGKVPPKDFEKNLREFVQEVEGIWAREAFTSDTLRWVFLLPHPFHEDPADPREVRLRGFGDAANKVAVELFPRAASVDLTRISSAEAVKIGGFARPGLEAVLMSLTGYRTFADEALTLPAAP